MAEIPEKSWPEIDWPLFSVAVRMRMPPGVTLRALCEASGIGVACLSRAQNGRPVSAANYLALCNHFRLDPWTYVRNVSRGTSGETGARP